jgi:hypothetical protein
VVQDKPFPKAKWLLSRAQQHPDIEWILVTESTDTKCTIEALHKPSGKQLSYTYTIEQAAKEGHTTGRNRANWEKIPKNMLRARCISMAVGNWVPGVVFGMPTAEEMTDV